MKQWLKLAGVLCLCGTVVACNDQDGPNPFGPTPSPSPSPSASPSPSPAPQPLALTVLHVNDHHSNLDSRSKTLQLSNAAGERVPVAVDAAGFPRVTAAIADLAQQSDNVLTLHAGDALTGTLFFNRAGATGEADAALMNTVCFDAFALGNHEFDKGDTELKNFLDLLRGGDCQTPALSANVQFGANSVLNPAVAPGVVLPSVVLERGGEQIGIVGLTIAIKTKQSSSPDPDTTFENEVTAAQREIDALIDQGINKIIVLSHSGYAYEQEIAQQLSGIDVLIGGDSHSLLGPDSLQTYGVGTPAGAYPTVLENADGDTVCVAQAWEYAQVVGELQISFDADGVVTTCTGTPHVLIGDVAADNTEDLAAFQADIEASGFLRVTEPDADAVAVLAPFKAQVDEFKAQVVATAPETLCTRRVPGGEGSIDFGRSGPDCNALGSVSLRGGDIQQIVAQAYLDVANDQYGGADITLQSGGGVRVPMQGEVTAANVIEVLPFGNLLFRLDITGDEVKAMIEDGLAATFGEGGSTGPYPYTGGLRFDVNSAAATGERASGLEVFDPETDMWMPVESTRTYKLFVLSFNATGGDGYTTLRDVPTERRLDIGVLDADVFQTWIDGLPRNDADLPVMNKLPIELYSTKSFAP